MQGVSSSQPQGVSAGAAGFVLATMLAVLAWVVLWHWSTAASVVRIWWNSETYAHGLLVLPISAWLIWRKRDAIGAETIAPTAWMSAPVLLAGFGWMLGQVVGVNALSHLALFCILVFALVGVLGWRLTRVFAFPLLFLFFGVPIGDFMMPVLMHYTAEFTVFALRLSGVPVYQDGLHFMVPNGRWSVVEACSGIRYLIASLTVGSLYAYLNYQRLSRRLLFVLISAIVPILANWVRAYLIVLLGYLTDNKLAAGVDHLIYGWVFFGVVIFLMFWIGARWREDPLPRAPATAGSDVAATGSAKRTPMQLLASVAPIALAIALFPPVLGRMEQAVPAFQVQLAELQAAPGWTRVDRAALDYQPDFSGQRGELLAHYRRDADGAVVSLYVAYFARQRPGHELVTWGNRLERDSETQRWARLLSRTDQLLPGTVRRTALAGGAARLEVWHWYWSNQTVLISDIRAKLLLAADKLTGRPDDAAFVAVFGPAIENDEGFREAVQAFVRDHWPALERNLAAAEVVHD